MRGEDAWLPSKHGTRCAWFFPCQVGKGLLSLASLLRGGVGKSSEMTRNLSPGSVWPDPAGTLGRGSGRSEFGDLPGG